MKFEVKCKSLGNSRLGVLRDLGRHNEMQTPMAMSYTRGGLLSLITHDVYKNMSIISNVAQIPLNSVYRNADAITKCSSGINEFSSIPEFLSYISIQDTASQTVSGQNTNKSVAVMGRHGKLDMTPAGYMKCMEALRPDWIQALGDSDTSINSTGKGITRKRLRKSVERTLSFLDACLELKSNSQNLEKTEIFGVIEGGYRSQDRIYSAKETSKRNVAGFTIEGFHNFLDNEFQLENIYELLCEVMVELPAHKPRILHGGYNAENILLAVEAGIDIFDSAYTYTSSTKGIALLMDYSEDSMQQYDSMDLNNTKYKNDQSALDDNCTCPTCEKHTRAYCCHLFITNELLSGILIMIHNTHQYQLFFEQIRNSLKSTQILNNSDVNNFQLLKDRVEKRLKRKTTC